jgi:hypothetical protein
MQTIRTSSAHTKGIWTVISDPSIYHGTPFIAAEDGHGIILATISHNGKGNYQGQLGTPMADARLMAAAPQLLDVCKALMSFESTLNKDAVLIAYKIIELASVAIAKAE